MGSNYTINRTENYHINELDTLGWELTVCNSLEPNNTPIRNILKNNNSYGNLLFHYLKNFTDLKCVNRVIEIGGGYGFFMRDLLELNPLIKAVMLDISPVLLKKQQDTLSEYDVEYVQSDFFSYDINNLNHFDFAILNENMGDFPTICGIETKSLFRETNDILLKRVKHYVDYYLLTLPDEEFINFNIGACDAIERLCESGIRFIYAGEHSCEMQFTSFFSSQYKIYNRSPEPISLCGHREYTINFSFIKRIAEKNNYVAKRGRFIDFIELRNSEKLHFIMSSHSNSDEHEIIRQFVEDLFKYEFLLLRKK